MGSNSNITDTTTYLSTIDEGSSETSTSGTTSATTPPWTNALVGVWALGSLLVFIVLILLIGGCIHLIVQQHKKRRRRSRNNSLSFLDIATIFDDTRESYATLRARNTSRFHDEESTFSSRRETHGYAELGIGLLDPDFDKSEEQINVASGTKHEVVTGQTKPEPPRKCNTLSGILRSRLAVGLRKNDRSTMDKYLTTRRGSSTSANDYVDNVEEEIRSVRTLPIGRDMSSRHGDVSRDGFVPEDDNLWEICSSDGSLEHDVTLRKLPDGKHSSDRLDSRHTVMSDLLRSSWVDMPSTSRDKDYSNLTTVGSKASLADVEGVFIPEGGSDHPLGEDVIPNIDQLSQNIIDMISENFSSKVQCRESDSYEQKMDRHSATHPFDAPATSPFVEQYFTESRPSPPPMPTKPTLPVKRVQSVKQLDKGDILPKIPSKSILSETLPRSEKRPLPPVPQSKRKQEILQPDDRKVPLSPSPLTSPKEIATANQFRRDHDTKKPMYNTYTPDEDSTEEKKDYENVLGNMCPESPEPVAKRKGQCVKTLPPPPPPKHCKPQILCTDSSDSSSSSLPSSSLPNISASSQTSNNFLKVTQQLQQKLAMRLPGQLMSRKPDTPSSPTDSD